MPNITDELAAIDSEQSVSQSEAAELTQQGDVDGNTFMTPVEDVDGAEGISSEDIDTELFPDGHPTDELGRVDRPMDGKPSGNLPPTEKQKREWQSRAMKAENMIREVEPLMPFIQLLQTDPQQALQLLQKEVGGSTSTASPSTPDTQPKLTVPVAPKKPENYDPVAAQTDPTSTSFKYLSEFSEYQQKFMEYVANRDAQRESEDRRRAQVAEQQAVIRRQVQGTVSVLKSKYGYNDAQAQDFIARMTNDDVYSLDNLVFLHRRLAGGQPKTPQGQPRDANLQRNIRRPLPVTSLGGNSLPTLTEEQSFNLGLMRNKRT